MSTIPGLSSVDDILDSDLVMITHANGQSYKMAGIEINKRNQAVIASNTTLTGAPLKTGNVVRAYFTADLVAVNSSTALSLSYNSVSYPVKVPKDGALVNYTPFEVDTNTYKYLQAYTTLELLYDGTNFIVLNNPVVISGSGFNIHADGTGKVNEVAANNMQAVTSNAVAAQYNALYTSFSSWETIWYYNDQNWIVAYETPMGKFLRIHFSGNAGWAGERANGYTILTITENKWKPNVSPNRFTVFVDRASDRIIANIDYESSGAMKIYFADVASQGSTTFIGLFGDALLLLW